MFEQSSVLLSDPVKIKTTINHLFIENLPCSRHYYRFLGYSSLKIFLKAHNPKPDILLGHNQIKTTTKICFKLPEIEKYPEDI